MLRVDVAAAGPGECGGERPAVNWADAVPFMALSGDTIRGGKVPPPNDDPQPSGGPGLLGLRVVVVEDEAVIAFEIQDLLESLGVEVVGSALSADAAVALTEAKRPDCLTMDIRLQGSRDGVDAAIEIFHRFGIRSIFVSAYSDPATVKRAEAAQPLGWVPKPVRDVELETSLRRLRQNPTDPN